MDDLDLDFEIQETENKVKNRFNELANKVKETARERDTVLEEKRAIELERETLAKERDFYASFTDSASQYPNAVQFKDQIKDKVLAGYTVEDATISVLAREGQLTSQPVMKRETVAGGSSSNAISNSGTKTVKEMSRDELRSALMDAERRGDISS